MSVTDKYNLAPQTEPHTQPQTAPGTQPQWKRADTQDGARVVDVTNTAPGANHMEERPWLYSLCVCCAKCDALIESCFCPLCQMSRQYNMVYNLQPSIHWPLCLGSLMGNFLLGNVVTCLLVWSLRTDLRRRYGIEGGCCSDMLTSMFCIPCALQQQLLEMTALGAFPGAFCFSEAPAEPVML